MAWTTPATRTTGTLITAALWNAAVIDNIRFLGVTHNHSGDAGDGATLPGITAVSGMIGVFDTSCPSGWTRVSAFDNKFLRGAASYGGTGGTDTHTHSDTAHSHTGTHTHAAGTLAVAAAGSSIAVGAGGTTIAAKTHTHTVAGTSGTPALSGSVTIDAASSLPPYIAVVFCKRN